MQKTSYFFYQSCGACVANTTADSMTNNIFWPSHTVTILFKN